MLRFFIFIVGLFFLSIPIPGFVPSDRFAWTGGTPHFVRQTPPLGRSENLTGPSFLLQWSPNTNTEDE